MNLSDNVQGICDILNEKAPTPTPRLIYLNVWSPEVELFGKD